MTENTANRTSQKVLISIIYKECIQLYSKSKQTKTNLIKKWMEALNRIFPTHMKRCLLIIGEMQIKTTTRHHLTSVRMVLLKKGRER